jgi:hypothetical protein
MLTITKISLGNNNYQCQIDFNFYNEATECGKYVNSTQFCTANFVGSFNHAILEQEGMLLLLRQYENSNHVLSAIIGRIESMRTSKFSSAKEFFRWLGSWFLPASWLLPPLPYWSKANLDLIQNAIIDISNNDNLSENTINLLCDVKWYEYSILNCLIRSHFAQNLRNVQITAHEPHAVSQPRPRFASHTSTGQSNTSTSGHVYAPPPSTHKPFSGPGQKLGTKT